MYLGLWVTDQQSPSRKYSPAFSDIPAALFRAHSTLAIPHGNASDLVSAGIMVAGEVAFETVCKHCVLLHLAR